MTQQFQSKHSSDSLSTFEICLDTNSSNNYENNSDHEAIVEQQHGRQDTVQNSTGSRNPNIRNPIFTANTDDDNMHQNDQAIKDYSIEELQSIVNEVQVVDMNDEMMDPIEWIVRKVVPIPKQYYWEIIDTNNPSTSATMNNEESKYNKNENNCNDLYSKISIRTKIWHNTISLLDNIQNFATKQIAEPFASGVGLTGSRFYFVTNTMTNNDMHQSQRYIQRRNNDDTTTTTDIEKIIIHSERHSGDNNNDLNDDNNYGCHDGDGYTSTVNNLDV